MALVGEALATLRGGPAAELAAPDERQRRTASSRRLSGVTAPGRLGRGEVHRLLESAGLSPRKALGQNFVVDPNTVERIARLAGRRPGGPRSSRSGAGLGSLTLALAATGGAR